MIYIRNRARGKELEALTCGNAIWLPLEAVLGGARPGFQGSRAREIAVLRPIWAFLGSFEGRGWLPRLEPCRWAGCVEQDFPV